MSGDDLISGRKQKGWSQLQAAQKLKVSQPYLSLLEKGVRRVPEELARRAAAVFGLSAVALPVTALETVQAADSNSSAADLGSLGYPGFSYLKTKRRKNPAEVLLSALSARRLDTRVSEALPWLLLEYPNLDWKLLISSAKLRDLQNKLGLVTCVARILAERRGEFEKAELLRAQEKVLERSRLFIEDTLCNDSLTETERRWLQTNRTDEAKHWRVLTDLSPEHLNYAP